METSVKSTPPKIHYYDPDHNVIKLKYEKLEEFTELVISHITRILDLPGTHLEILRGQCDTILKDNANKLSQSAKKSWNPLKKKDSKVSGHILSDENLLQIQQLTDFLGDHLTTEGLFRKPGNSIRQSQLLTALGTGVSINFEKSQFQAHDAASVLKTILGQLAEPLLLPSRHFDAHMQISTMNKYDEEKKQYVPDKGKRIEALQLILLLLPTAHRKVLRGIFDLLYQTAKHQQENKMNAANLSAMFAPHLIWPRSVKASDIHENIALLNDHVAFMIRHSQKIFVAPPYIRDAASVYYPPSSLGMSPQVSTTLLVAPSSAVKRTASELLHYKDKARSETENAINDLYDQVNNLPSSSKKKKMVKNFSKHHEVLKYECKTRKRHRTFSGMLRKKSLTLNKKKDSYHRFAQPGDDVFSTPPKENEKFSKSIVTCEPKQDNSKDNNSTQSASKSASHVSLPERITRNCHLESMKSPKLLAMTKQIRNLHQRRSASPSVKTSKNSGPGSLAKDCIEKRTVKISTV